MCSEHTHIHIAHTQICTQTHKYTHSPATVTLQLRAPAMVSKYTNRIREIGKYGNQSTEQETGTAQLFCVITD